MHNRHFVRVKHAIMYFIPRDALLGTDYIIGASEAKPLSSGWCENRKLGSLGGWLVGWLVGWVLRRVNTIL